MIFRKSKINKTNFQCHLHRNTIQYLLNHTQIVYSFFKIFFVAVQWLCLLKTVLKVENNRQLLNQNYSWNRHCAPFAYNRHNRVNSKYVPWQYFCLEKQTLQFFQTILFLLTNTCLVRFSSFKSRRSILRTSCEKYTRPNNNRVKG